MIAVIDYGRGNLGSVEKAFGRVGIPALVTQDPRVVDDAEGVVLPGDGAFHDAMGNLERLGLVPALRRALDGTRSFLGICLGYQLLFSVSEEFGEGRGLDLIPGVVRRFPPGRKVPHMGWNRVHHDGTLALFDGIPDGAHFYFVHSYYPVVAGSARPDPTVGGLSEAPAGSVVAGSARPDPAVGGLSPAPAGSVPLRAAWCEYGVRFAAAVEVGRVAATQFHPEKSQRWGLRLLENFAALVKEGR
ncbi:MAG: imidazole glycerol phosphate synthase subunit HisH [Candidatus Rokubacteria bacterium]|nr:imidazole glycerol phosphate synthase subunit HisH [Candidatus Rokubacteria bacterium]